MKFFVKDTGIGLSKTQLEIIFDRFVQADFSITRKYGGSGLGLSISKGIVSAFGGEIWAESKEGEGSQFYFTIPYQKAEVDEHSTMDVDNKKINLTDKTILLVEDDEKSILLYKEIFNDLKINLVVATKGKQAIDLFKSEKNIDIVLLDIHLQDMDGFEITKELKKIKKSVPIIIQTADSIISVKKHSVDAGCDDIIAKPITINVLMTTLNRFLS